MAGRKALGRNYNFVPVASGKPFSVQQCSTIGFLAVAATTATTSLTFTASTAFTGGTTVNYTPANGFAQPAVWYRQTVGDGTAAWTAVPAVWTTNVLTIAATAGQVSYVDILVSQLADLYCYLTCTAINASLTAIVTDLLVQRTPENLKILGAT
jgi:hypothetical protein